MLTWKGRACFSRKSCRAAYNSGDARGPYSDKDGHACLDYVPSIGRYGASMLLGADGDQLVPGHPYFWQMATRTWDTITGAAA